MHKVFIPFDKTKSIESTIPKDAVFTDDFAKKVAMIFADQIKDLIDKKGATAWRLNKS